MSGHTLLLIEGQVAAAAFRVGKKVSHHKSQREEIAYYNINCRELRHNCPFFLRFAQEGGNVNSEWICKEIVPRHTCQGDGTSPSVELKKRLAQIVSDFCLPEGSLTQLTDACIFLSHDWFLQKVALASHIETLLSIQYSLL